jgi:hypothetical protein
MSRMSGKAARLVFVALVCVGFAKLASPQQVSVPVAVPPNFSTDGEFASWVRSQLVPYTEPATGRYAVGRQVMETLLKHLPPGRTHASWDLRIAKNAGNVFSSPDGTIFVDEEFAQAMGTRAGLWAAALSHEISHVVHRDWARRYLLQKTLSQDRGSQIILGDTGVIAGSWVDARGASRQLSDFCQAMELEADADGLMLMTRAGFDPDFVPALHRLMEASPEQSDENVLDPSHPRWGDRDQRLQKAFAAAGKEYDHLWPDRYASPGGNSPIVVAAGVPTVKRVGTGELQIVVTLNCRNLAGSVEVVLRFTGTDSGRASELRQFTGCTSNQSLIAFNVPLTETRRGHSHVEAEISVLDDSGTLLTRSRTVMPVR